MEILGWNGNQWRGKDILNSTKWEWNHRREGNKGVLGWRKHVRTRKNAKTKFYMLLFLDCHILPRSSLGAEERKDKDCFLKAEAVDRFLMLKDIMFIKSIL